MIATIMAGAGAFTVWPSMATVSTPSRITQPLGSIEKLKTKLEIDRANEPFLASPRFFVQRSSSNPPGESHTGRASSSPAGTVPESGRDSGRPLDPSEHLYQENIGSPSPYRHEEEIVTPKKSEDPVEGGRQSQPATKRRGGIVK